MAIPNMPDYYHAMVVLDGSSGGSLDDRYNWNLYFRNDEALRGPEDTAGAIAARVQAFLDHAGAGMAAPIGALLPKYVNRAATVRVYDLGEAGTPPNPRTPYVMPVTIPNPTAGVYSVPMPPDVAIRLTTRAASAPMTAAGVTSHGKPIRPRRRTGGFYFGPLMVNACSPSVDDHGEVRAEVRADLADALAALASDSPVQLVKWVLLSEGLADAWPVTDGFIDDEFDTIRKRGTSGSTRTEWVAD